MNIWEVRPVAGVLGDKCPIPVFCRILANQKNKDKKQTNKKKTEKKHQVKKTVVLIKIYQ